ncbi:uncharacterized protein LOC123875026 [Maniola jurtina]|uniref:uncharacterized protein LOC123875026 n=1 Tax=Maniola jurtina TaxID=191418 RepID=UPI001E68F899|nr:uncharacterized protein LOC123875026 [Maniola jurtina]
MIKVAIFFLFLTVVCCANGYRQGEDLGNPFIRNYRYTDGNQELSDREWQMRREIERRNQRQRAINQQAERLAEWFEGNYEENEQERYERDREQQRWRVREEEYEPVYERNVQPYWTPYEYDSQAYPWGAYAVPYVYY